MNPSLEGPPAGSPARAPGVDFIRSMIAEDLAAGRFDGRVVTRFPPEPNGFLHIGHAKSIALNFGIAREFGRGPCHLRFDDTNPETEDIRFVEAITEDLRWLGYDPGEHIYFASDYFEPMYRFGEELISKGLAYVDSSTEDEIREARGTVTEPGYPTRYRDRSVEENLDLFRRMRAGEFADGAHVLRGRIDLAAPNMLMRDPILYRIRHAEHYRQGDDWCIYPLYDYAHPIEDALECITHSLCTLEFENNRELYDWVVSNITVPCRPYQTEFARLALDYTVMSKRKFLELVNGGLVSGWDDPRMPTIAGLRRRGVTPESIRALTELVGVSKANTRVDIGKLEYAIRDDLNRRVPRLLCVPHPLRVVITNWEPGRVDEIEAPLYPHDVPLEGSRTLPFSGELFIDRDDFREDPPRGFHRLAPGREVRLRYAFVIRCDQVVKNDAGDIVELRCSYDPATRGGAAAPGRGVKGTIQWVSAAQALTCELRLYDRLLTVADVDAAAAESGRDWKEYLNPESLVVMSDARVEPFVRDPAAGERFQFERVGYFCVDPDSRPETPVFNRTVTLKDSYREDRDRDRDRDRGAKVRTEAAAAPPAPPPRAEELERERRALIERGIDAQQADVLTREAATAWLYRETSAAGADALLAANWIVNELPRVRAERALDALPFGPRELAGLLRLVASGQITTAAAREVLAELAERGGEPAAIVAARGLLQLSDESALGAIIDEILAANPEKAAQYRAGRTGLLGFFMGQVMKRTGGRANPERVQHLLAARLD
ncbi:MAG TPA: glutamine--tRNA ligase/YqeY domain fusion protein [Longimicrobiales bacterium]|nr:glutamine--tRNA ligase/YqeY domain fusion protein [Longimicrobiales bacterium]